jgi:excisionase family DNA binding protein
MTVEEYLDPKEVASLLKVTIKTLAQWRWQRKHLPYRKVGSVVRYRRSDLENLLEASTRPVARPADHNRTTSH